MKERRWGRIRDRGDGQENRREEVGKNTEERRWGRKWKGGGGGEWTK